MIFLDNASTTSPLKEALDVFLDVNIHHYGNSSSVNRFGQEADEILEQARADVLKILGLGQTHRCIFTSGATESNNLALKGLAFKYQKRGRRIISDAVEHPSVLKALEQLRDEFGFDVVILPVKPDGTVDPQTLRAAMNDQTILVSVMAVNNELGSINDLPSLAAVVHAFPKAFFHVDATQSICKENLDYSCADLVSFSGHKFGATKGTGALLYLKKIAFEPLDCGGEQELGFRAGTVDVAGDAALAKALSIEMKDIKASHLRIRLLHDRLVSYLLAKRDVTLNSPLNGTPYVLSFSLNKKKASVVVEALSREGVYVSTVSACSSKVTSESYVVRAIGHGGVLSENPIRISFSALSTMADVESFISAFDRICQEVKDR